MRQDAWHAARRTGTHEIWRTKGRHSRRVRDAALRVLQQHQLSLEHVTIAQAQAAGVSRAGLVWLDSHQRWTYLLDQTLKEYYTRIVERLLTRQVKLYAFLKK